MVNIRTLVINEFDLRTISNFSTISGQLCTFQNFRTAGTPAKYNEIAHCANEKSYLTSEAQSSKVAEYGSDRVRRTALIIAVVLGFRRIVNSEATVGHSLALVCEVNLKAPLVVRQEPHVRRQRTRRHLTRKGHPARCTTVHVEDGTHRLHCEYRAHRQVGHVDFRLTVI